MAANFFQILLASWKRFNEDRCFTAAIVISYFSLLCLVPLIALFAFLGAKILGNPELIFRSLNIFTDEFFAQMDPAFFKKLQALGGSLSNLGWFGIIGSLIAASFLFSNLISTINRIFRSKYSHSFVYNRLMEYVVMLLAGVFLLLSLSITALWIALQQLLHQSPVFSGFINHR